MKNNQQVVSGVAKSPTLIPHVLAPILMMAFWTLLGGAAGIRIAQKMWPFLGFDGGEVAIAIPVGSVVGAVAGARVGLIRNPRWLVLLTPVHMPWAWCYGSPGRLPRPIP